MTRELKIAIKTYQRAEVLQSKTLKLLQRHGFNTEAITLFVASEAERDNYHRTLNGFSGDIVVQQEPGIRGVVCTYRKHYPAGQWVLHCDDDLIDIMVAATAQQLVPIKDLHAYTHQMFQLSVQSRVRMWSIYPAANAFFMQNAVVAGLRFCSGCFHGFISDAGSDASLLPTVNYKDDVESSIRYFIRDGAVLRDERVVPKTQYFKDGGGGTAGSGHENRLALHIADAKAIAAAWPGLCKTVAKKSFGGLDVRMNSRIKPSVICPSPASF
jgi:hypothetical protein